MSVVCRRFCQLRGSRSPHGLSALWKPLSTGSEAWTQPMHYLDGTRTDPRNPKGEMTILEPATGKRLCAVPESSRDDVDEAVQSAKKAFETWSFISGAERSEVLHKAARIIMDNVEEIAKAEVHDTGKPLYEARMDVLGCADTMSYCAGLARTIFGQHIDLGRGNFGYTRREPLGVVGGIGAWNFPFQMVCWKSVGALSCGNTMVYKPSPLTPITSTMMAEIYTDAGLPKGAFNVVQGVVEAGESLSVHPDIAMMTFTGSVPTGVKVMQSCSKGIKNVLLELGGKSPLIIFEDSDLDNAVKGTMLANYLTQGQVCSNGTRVFVQRSVYQTFLDKLCARVKNIRIGDPMDEATTMGAIISEDQANRIMGYIEGAKKQGATALIGGERVRPGPDSLRDGHFISPCVLVDVTDDMTVVREEIFGPVACVLPFDTEQEVIARANDTDFGLAGGVFTKDLARAHRVAAQVEAGNIYVNTYNAYPSELPFGGYKMSGLGRENSTLNIDAFTQVKTVYVEMGDVESVI